MQLHILFFAWKGRNLLPPKPVANKQYRIFGKNYNKQVFKIFCLAFARNKAFSKFRIINRLHLNLHIFWNIWSKNDSKKRVQNILFGSNIQHKFISPKLFFVVSCRLSPILPHCVLIKSVLRGYYRMSVCTIR